MANGKIKIKVNSQTDVRHWYEASPDEGLQQLFIVPNTLKGIVDGHEAVTEEQ